MTAAGPTDPERRPAGTGETVERLRPGWNPALPTGVTTFLMTDIEDSTRLWETSPAAMAEALMRHDEMIAEVVRSHGGHFVAAGDGDATTSIFASAAQAVRAAIDIAHQVARVAWPEGAPIRVRFGLHTGEADERPGNYFGTLPNHAARVRGEARGGEILLSEQTTALVDGDLPPGFTIVDLGPHRLRGIEQPERISALAGPGLETPRAADECPYRGLLSFRRSDRQLFFGRERILGELLDRLEPGTLLALVGASGSGKSSLLSAGVAAAVDAGEIQCASSTRLITPGAEPPEDLEGPDTELLVVDQFEELYTQSADAERRAGFIEALLARRSPVVIGLRADFYGEISADARLAEAVAANQMLLGPMGEEDLRSAIEAPARLAGLELGPGLVALVLRDAAGQPGALPLISHALRATWERRDGRTLSVEAYRETGGVSSAIAQTAETIVQQTPIQRRPLLRAIFLRLTELGEGVEDTRRRVRSEDLVPYGASAEEVRELLERLAEARLVTLDEGTVELAHEVLISRWPRLRGWLEEDREGIRLYRRLCDAARNWEAAGREPGDLYRGGRLEAALEWSRANGALLNDTEKRFLDSSAEESANVLRHRQLTNRRLRRSLAAAGGLLVAARALLAFALVSRHDAVDAEASARSQALATESRAQSASDPQLALLLARAALASAATPQAELAASEALDANTLRAQLPSLGVQGCSSSDYLLLLDGGRTAAADTCQGYVVFADLVHHRILRKVRVGPTTTDMALAAGGQALIVVSGHNLVSVNLSSGKTRLLYTAPFEIEQLAGPPGHFLAIADRETIALVDLRHDTLHVVAHADASNNAVNGIMSASASTLLIASTGQTQGRGELLPLLTALNVDTGARWTVPLAVPPRIADVVYLRVSPDGRTWYVTGSTLNSDHEEQVAATWAIDPRTRKVLWLANGPAGTYGSPVQVSPDGSLVAVGYGNGEAAVLDAATGHLVALDSSHSTVASGDLAIAADDRTLVTLSLDGLIRLWSAQGSERLRLQAPPETTLSFMPEGKDLILFGSRGEIVNGAGQTVRSFPGVAGFTSCSSCFSATPGLGLLTYLDPESKEPRVIEIEGRTGRRVAAVTVQRLEAQGVAPDGDIVADYVEDNRLEAELVDPHDGAVRHFAPGVTETGCTSGAPSFNGDGSMMAISDGCVRVDVWDVHSGRLLRTIRLPEHGSSSSLMTPDGRYVLVQIAVGTFARADLANGAVEEVPGARAASSALAVSPNGRYYAIGRQDGSVDEYDARTLRLIRHHELANPIKTLVFSPNSSELAVEDTSDVVRVWDSCEICENPTQLARRAAAESVRSLTASERATFGVH
jgi:class 3 adenylate cyclase/WD40 repeat protein/energy-coupling factor transporter ATP-binding protein EcfA2